MLRNAIDTFCTNTVGYLVTFVIGGHAADITSLGITWEVLKFPPRQPDDGHHRPKHVVVQCTVIKLHLSDTVVFGYPHFPRSHTHNGDDTIPRLGIAVLYTVKAALSGRCGMKGLLDIADFHTSEFCT